MGAKGGRGPPQFFYFFLILLYYYYILLFTYGHEYGPPLLAFLSFCMLDFCFLW